MSIDAMKLALEVLEEMNELSIGEHAICLPAEIDTAMDALRQAIEQAEQAQPLTDEEIISHFRANVDTGSLLSFEDGVRYAEAAHGIGENT